MNEKVAVPAEPRYGQHPDVLFTQISEWEGVLLSLPASRYYTLNETGCAVWQALADGATPAGVSHVLESGYRVQPAEALAHTRAFLAALLGEGLIEEKERRP